MSPDTLEDGKGSCSAFDGLATANPNAGARDRLAGNTVRAAREVLHRRHGVPGTGRAWKARYPGALAVDTGPRQRGSSWY